MIRTLISIFVYFANVAFAYLAAGAVHIYSDRVLPGADLIGMDLMAGRDLLDRLVAPGHFQRYPGLESPP